MLIVVGIRLGEEAVNFEEGLPRKFRPKPSRAAMVDRDWVLSSIPLMNSTLIRGESNQLHLSRHASPLVH